MWTKSRHNKNALRLMRQIEESDTSFRESSTPQIRKKSHDEIFYDLRFWDRPPRSNGSIRNWKKFRKKQYKAP